MDKLRVMRIVIGGVYKDTDRKRYTRKDRHFVRRTPVHRVQIIMELSQNPITVKSLLCMHFISFRIIRVSKKLLTHAWEISRAHDVRYMRLLIEVSIHQTKKSSAY